MGRNRKFETWGETIIPGRGNWCENYFCPESECHWGTGLPEGLLARVVGWNKDITTRPILIVECPNGHRFWCYLGYEALDNVVSKIPNWPKDQLVGGD